MVRNKRGWIKILEAGIAVMLIASVLLVVYSKQPDRNTDSGEYVYNLQKEILDDLYLNETLRKEVLSSNNGVLSPVMIDFIRSKTPQFLNSKMVICSVTTPPTPCKMNSTDFLETQNYDLFVSETILSSNLTDYNPKKVKLFIWENR